MFEVQKIYAALWKTWQKICGRCSVCGQEMSVSDRKLYSTPDHFSQTTTRRCPNGHETISVYESSAG